jgi:hypothetical protein
VMLTAPQNTDAGRLLRALPRPAWRAICRAERIAYREVAMATQDTMIFGTGAVMSGSGGPPQRDGSDVCSHVDLLDIPIRKRLRG